jgi:hypothetical protein
MHKRGNKRAAKRTRKTTRARKTAAPHTTRKPATRPKPPALARERRTLTEEPAAPTAVAPEMETRSPEPRRAAGEDGASEAGATNSVEEAKSKVSPAGNPMKAW